MGFLFPTFANAPMDLEGKKPAPSTPIYSGEAHGSSTPSPGASLPPVTPLPLAELGEALPRSQLLPPPRRHAAGSPSTSPSPLLDQEGGEVFPTVRVLNAEVLSVQHLVIGDSNHVEYDYIITLQASARDLQVVCRCKLTPSTRCLDELIDGSW